MNIAPDLSAKLTAWLHAQDLASQWKAEEEKLRREIFATAFPEPKEGTDNLLNLGYDRTLVGDNRTNFTVDRGLLDDIMKQPKSGNLRVLVEKVIRFDPKVRDGEFKKLSHEDKLALADLLTQRPGLPSLEIKTTSRMRKKPK